MIEATVPLARSPLMASFQHMEPDEFAKEVRFYNRLWEESGRFPQITFSIPGPFKRLGPRMYICVSWPVIGKTLMQEGTVDQHDIRSLQVLVPRGTSNRVAQFVMTTGVGALSRLLIHWGVAYQYPHLAQLNNEYLSFVMPAGEKHTAMRGVYAATADAERMRSLNYVELLTEGTVRYLEDLRAQHLAEQRFSTDIALIGRATVTAAMARLFGVSPELLTRLVDLSRAMDHTVVPRASHLQLQEADRAVAQALALLEAAIEDGGVSFEGLLAREYQRLVADGPYTRGQWAYIALMLIRVSIENQIDSVNLVLRGFAGLSEEQRAALREEGPVEEFTRAVLRADPPVGFILRRLPRAYTFPTPVPGEKLLLPRGSFVLFVPRLLQSTLLRDHCGEYLLTFGFGRDMVCPGRQLGLLTITTCSREIFRRFDLTFTGQIRTSENAFFRRILSAPGVVTVLDRAVRVSAVVPA